MVDVGGVPLPAHLVNPIPMVQLLAPDAVLDVLPVESTQNPVPMPVTIPQTINDLYPMPQDPARSCSIHGAQTL